MSDTTGVPEEVAFSSPRPSMFWRVLRVLIIVYCGVLGAVMLFVIVEEGAHDYFNIDDLQSVRDARAFLEWLILNPGNASILLMAISGLAWAVAWHRGEGRRAYRLELFYGAAAALMFVGTAGIVLAAAVDQHLRGFPGAIAILLVGSIYVAVANAPALMMASYVLWGMVRRSMPGRRV